MIKFNESVPVELESRLGRVGSIQSFDLWDDIETIDKAKTRVADIATLSYGLDWARSPLSLYQKLVTSDPLPHISCLEFLPVPPIGYPSALPNQSMRGMFARYGDEGMWKFWDMWMMHGFKRPAFGFKVEAPIFVLRQWMRSRTLSVDTSWVDEEGMDPWALLEMSRRYTPGKRVPLEFYGSNRNDKTKRKYDLIVEEYYENIELGMPIELARIDLPTSLITQVYIGGYNNDWDWFTQQRSDSHAQTEIHVFSDYIKGVINACK